MEKELDNTNINADYLSLQQLVYFAEKFDFYSSAVFDYLQERLSHFDWNNYQSIVLGCTHFPFFKSQIESILPEHVQVIDGSAATVERLKSFVPKSEETRIHTFEYYISKQKVKGTQFTNYLKALDSFEISPQLLSKGKLVS